uniref:Protein kinase domain-containing protein n=1 Tax=Gouania willdenowi TaxID=441366 RepID=A0A8C5EUE7_GOUWI
MLVLDNVMLANHEENPYKVKLIDFGLAIPSSSHCVFVSAYL